MCPSPYRRQCIIWMRKQLSTGVGLWITITMLPTIVVIGIILGVTLLPRHCRELKGSSIDANILGQRNLSMEHVFVAASLHSDEDDITLGPWMQALLDLVSIIGHQHVFLSIYKDGPAPFPGNTLEDFSTLVSCNKSIVLGYSDMGHAKVPAEDKCLERIADQAKIHNRALQPLVEPHSPAFSIRFSKLLFINDVAFDPVDAANLLLLAGQNIRNDQKPCEASCATDFINPLSSSLGSVLEGVKSHSSSGPKFPWYSADENDQSQGVLLDPRDVTRAESCWGGLVVIAGKWFQPDGLDKSMAVAKLIVHHTEATRPSNGTFVTVAAISSTTAEAFTTETRSTLSSADLGSAVYMRSVQ